MATEETLKEELTPEDLMEVWPILSAPERLEGLRELTKVDAEDFFLLLDSQSQLDLLLKFPPPERRSWIRLMAPDDIADIIQKAPEADRPQLLGLLEESSRSEIKALLAYAEDDAGGIMNPRFAQLRPDMTADEAIRYLRKQSREKAETIYYAYVLDNQKKLVGVVSFRNLFIADALKCVSDIMSQDVISVPEEMDQEKVGQIMAKHDLMALPVVDKEGGMKGIVSLDDIVDVVQDEATEDIQKMGATEALDKPYMQVGLFEMIRKRGAWLSILFIGETFTASAMLLYEDQLARAVVLALFIPLIISSGGNSGSQAATLVIRAMALGEVRIRDWWHVAKREILVGLGLGLFLGLLGLLRIALWPNSAELYGPHFVLIGWVIACSLVGVVTWGTIVGSMLPFIFKRLGLDPASASTPFVATLVDVTGLMIYFTAAQIFLRGTLL